MITRQPPVSTSLQLSDSFVQQYANKEVPWGPVGYVVFKRTYARPISITTHGYTYNDTEEWYQTCQRAVNSVLTIGAGAFSIKEAERLYDHMFNLRACVSGRALWQLGTATVAKLGGASLNNCWALTFDKLDSFLFLFDMLMLGGGVGYNIQREYVYQLPPIKYNVSITRKDDHDVDFIVPDNREGWVELLKRVLDAFTYTGKSFTYSTKCLRGKGAAIKGFGGVASGPEDLVRGISQICDVLRSRIDKRLRPIDVLDINNIIGTIVVAGNVRRSAQIACGDPDDFNFLRAKRWSRGDIPGWRAMSNNTIVANSFDNIPEEFWNGYGPKEGEPYGLFNLKLAQSKGRLKDTHRKDPEVIGTNPCAEITLADKEPCNLTEIFLPNIRSVPEFVEVATLLFKVAKLVTTLPYHWELTQNIISKNRRIGSSLTGVVQASPELLSTETLDYVYKSIELADEVFSAELTKVFKKPIPTSIKLTTIKPSGSLSLLAGVSPGCHPEYAPYYIRRVRMSADDKLVRACSFAGYHVEQVINLDGSKDPNTVAVSFPIKARNPDKVSKNFTAIDQLELVKFLQTNWSDNSVSCTIYYKTEELPGIQEWLRNNFNTGVKSVSFLLHSDHGFIQAPLEEITADQFNKMSSKLKPLSIGYDVGGDLQSSVECEGGACPIK